MATESITITNKNPLNEGMNYQFLREQGIKHIEKLSSKLWTDFNTHDPGITMLEMLCYAITDLGYRCNFDIKDILELKELPQQLKEFYTIAEAATNKPLTINDYRRILLDTGKIRNVWLDEKTDFEIKYRIGAITEYNLFVPLKGLYNVLVEFEEDNVYGDLNDNSINVCFKLEGIQGGKFIEYEVEFPEWDTVPTIIDTIESGTSVVIELVRTDLFDISGEQFNHGANIEITIDTTTTIPFFIKLRAIEPGIIINYPEYMDELVITIQSQGVALVKQFAAKRKHIKDLLTNFKKLLHANRNLCEDFVNFRPLNIQEIAINAEIQLVQGTNVENTLAEVYYRIDRFLSPLINFYSIEELLDKNKTTEEIFEGPRLNNGFIDENELLRDSRMDIIYISDLIQILMDIPGVIAIKKLDLSNYVLGIQVARSVDNCLELTEPKKFLPKLSIKKSDVVFIENNRTIPETLPEKKFLIEEAIQKLKEKQAIDRKKTGVIGTEQTDIPVPAGEYSEIEEYYTIQDQFPSIYRLGSEGIADSETPLRKAQAKQMKGYLLFFEQLLANYLTQLANVSKLLAVKGGDDEKRTYYNNTIFSVPQVQELIKDYTSGSYTDFSEYINQPGGSGYSNAIDTITETEEIYYDRRNRFLNHLIARFSENFSEYSVYLFNKYGDKAIETLVKDKAAFLGSYPEVSAERAKAFNYKDETPLADSTMLSATIAGLKRRVARLLGMEVDEQQYKIAPYLFTKIIEDPVGEYEFRIIDQYENILFASTVKYYNEPDAATVLQKTLLLAVKPEYYIQETTNGPLSIIDENGDKIANGTMPSLNPDEYINYLTNEFFAGRMKDDFHTVENILLRTNNYAGNNTLTILTDGLPADTLQSIVNNSTENTCPPKIILDQYSFRIDVILPAWTSRFSDINFRRVFKDIIRMETPAHIMIRFYWVSEETMYNFENCYQSWLQTIKVDNIPLPVTATGFMCMVSNINTMENLYDAYYVVQPKRFVTSYIGAETVAYVIDTDGITIEAVLLKNNAVVQKISLPDTNNANAILLSILESDTTAGLYLNPTTGKITINDLETLKSIVQATPQTGDSVQFPLDINTTNSGGEVVNHHIVIKFISDIESRLILYTTETPIEYYENTKEPASSPYIHIAQYTNDTYANFKRTTAGEIVIAEFSDDNGSIEMARVLSLQIGNTIITSNYVTALAGIGFAMDTQTGLITVSDDTLLLSGVQIPIKVETTDIEQGTTIHNFNLYIKPDTETDVIVEPARNEDTYAEGDLIATLYDDNDGGIAEVLHTSTTFSEIGLSSTIVANPDTNKNIVEIRIASLSVFITFMHAHVATGNNNYFFNFALNVKDVQGGETNPCIVPITVKIDTEAQLTVEQARNQDTYITNAVLATITDANGGLVSVVETTDISDSGLGITLVNITGGTTKKAILFISNITTFANSLTNTSLYTLSGSPEKYTRTITVNTVDADGGKSEINIGFEILKDHEAEIFTTPVKNQDAYLFGDLIAILHDEEESGIISATVNQRVRSTFTDFVGGDYLSSVGLRLQIETITGYTHPVATIRVQNVTIFRSMLPGTNYIFDGTHYNLTVKVNTIDQAGGKSLTDVLIKVKKDFEGTYLINRNDQIINNYIAGEAIVLFSDDDGDITALTSVGTGTFTSVTNVVSNMSGALPPGMAYQGDTIVVTDTSLLYPGTYSFTTRSTDINGGTTDHTLVLILQRRVIDFTVNVTIEPNGNTTTTIGGGGRTELGGVKELPSRLLQQPEQQVCVQINTAQYYSGLNVSQLLTTFASSFGQISLSTSTSLTFCYTSRFENYNSALEATYYGLILTNNNEPVQGTMRFVPVSLPRIIKFTPTIETVLLESPTTTLTSGKPTKTSLIETTELMVRKLNTATFNQETATLSTDLQLATELRTGVHDKQIATEFNVLTDATASMIKETSQKLSTATGQEKIQAQQDLNLYAELYTKQVTTLVDFVGMSKQEDLTTNSELMGTFRKITNQINKM